MIYLSLAAIWLHFIGDFLLQTDKMALNKSSSGKWLTIHVVVYALAILPLGWQYAVYNAILHLVVDFGTSRATTFLYSRGHRHWFFVIIGLDQAVHVSWLLWLLPIAQPFFFF
jgi:hypothetical protein